MTIVQLTYFSKATGTCIAQVMYGSKLAHNAPLNEYQEEVASMLILRRLPELHAGLQDKVFVSVDVPTHPKRWPFLVFDKSQLNLF